MKVQGILTLAAAMVSLVCCTGRSGYVTLTGYAQGGVYAVKYNSSGVKAKPQKVKADVDSILNAIDFSLSGYNKGSILSRRNRGEEVEPDRYFREVLGISERYRELSGGAFNAAAAPVFDVWGFGFTADSLPSRAAIDSALAECAKGNRLNFNAVAQGYSCDVIAEYLHGLGVHDMLVDIGEIYCEGLNANGEGWSIGIDTPEDGNNSPGASLSGIWQSDGNACGIVTSGNYRKYYIKDGRKYAHTIDPRTGYPVDHNLLSATVTAPTGADADALATWFMVIGFEQAAEYVSGHEGIEACLITADTLWHSEGFRMR